MPEREFIALSHRGLGDNTDRNTPAGIESLSGVKPWLIWDGWQGAVEGGTAGWNTPVPTDRARVREHVAVSLTGTFLPIEFLLPTLVPVNLALSLYIISKHRRQVRWSALEREGRGLSRSRPFSPGRSPGPCPPARDPSPLPALQGPALLLGSGFFQGLYAAGGPLLVAYADWELRVAPARPGARGGRGLRFTCAGDDLGEMRPHRARDMCGALLLSNLGNEFEALLAKVLVQGECLPDTQSSHGDEAGAVDQAEVSTSGHEHGAYCLKMRSLIDPVDTKDRENVLVECSGGLDPQSVLHQSVGLQKHVAVAQDSYSGFHETHPLGLGRLMVGFAGIHERE